MKKANVAPSPMVVLPTYTADNPPPRPATRKLTSKLNDLNNNNNNNYVTDVQPLTLLTSQNYTPTRNRRPILSPINKAILSPSNKPNQFTPTQNGLVLSPNNNSTNRQIITSPNNNTRNSQIGTSPNNNSNDRQITTSPNNNSTNRQMTSPNNNVKLPPNYGFNHPTFAFNLVASTPVNRRNGDEEDNDSGIYDFDESLRSPVTKEPRLNGNRSKEVRFSDKLPQRKLIESESETSEKSPQKSNHDVSQNEHASKNMDFSDVSNDDSDGEWTIYEYDKPLRAPRNMNTQMDSGIGLTGFYVTDKTKPNLFEVKAKSGDKHTAICDTDKYGTVVEPDVVKSSTSSKASTDSVDYDVTPKEVAKNFSKVDSDYDVIGDNAVLKPNIADWIDNKSSLFENKVQRKEVAESPEISRDMKISKTPDVLPCKHVLCHRCIRKSYGDGLASILCPVCTDSDIEVDCVNMNHNNDNDLLNNNSAVEHNIYKRCADEEVSTDENRTISQGTEVAKSVGNIEPEKRVIAIVEPDSTLSKYHEMVDKFENVDLNLRRLKAEAVETSQVGMSYHRVLCDLCHENHGILNVVQQQDKLAIDHKRPEKAGYRYRLRTGEVVTTYSSRTVSSSVCVPCTFNNLHTGDTRIVSRRVPSNVSLAEVGKVVLRKSAPIATLESLEGKSQCDTEHEVSLHIRADNFSFNRTSRVLQDVIVQQERELARGISTPNMTSMSSNKTSQIEDSGKIYHVKENNKTDFVQMRANKVMPINRNSFHSDIW